MRFKKEELLPLADICDTGPDHPCYEILDPEERIVFIRDLIDESLKDLFAQLIGWAREDYECPESVPVKFLIDSMGGDAYAVRSLIDLMHTLPLTFITVNMGNCYSAAFYIFVAGDKRYTMPNGSFLVHDGTVNTDGVASKAMSAIAFIKSLDSRINDEVASRTKISPRMIETKGPSDWYFFSDEALDLGVVHEQIDNLVEVLYPYN